MENGRAGQYRPPVRWTEGFRVRYLETDRMGIVHHSVYLAWFEVGRTEFLRSLGFSYRALEAEGLYLPVARAEVRYLTTATYDDEIRVGTVMEKLTPARAVFAYSVVRGTDRLAEGRTEHAFLGREGRPLALPRLRPDLYEALRREVEAGGSA